MIIILVCGEYLWGIPALDSATYNCPSEKTGWGKETPKLFILWTCALLIVIAKYNLIKNCLLDTFKGKSKSDGDNSIREINA